VFSCVILRPAGSGKAMKLGSKSKDVDSFVDKLRSEGTGTTTYIILLSTTCMYKPGSPQE
jgi:hypothetical protein